MAAPGFTFRTLVAPEWRARKHGKTGLARPHPLPASAETRERVARRHSLMSARRAWGRYCLGFV
jgi:hypothetical protein